MVCRRGFSPELCVEAQSSGLKALLRGEAARKRVGVGGVDQARTHGVVEDVVRYGRQVFFGAQRAIVEAVLPDAPGVRMTLPQCAGARAFQPADQLRESDIRIELDQAVPVIGHQYPSHEVRAGPVPGFEQCADRIGGDVVIAEDRFACVGAERDQVDLARSRNAAFA